MYVVFILAMIVAAFGGPLIGAGSQASRAEQMIDTARTRVIADAVLAHHRAALAYAQAHPDLTQAITTDSLTLSSGAIPEPWQIYGRRTGLANNQATITTDFRSHMDGGDSKVVVTYSRTAGAFTGAFDRSYDRRGVLARLSQKVSKASYVGRVRMTNSPEIYFANRDFAAGFNQSSETDRGRLRNAYSDRELVAHDGRDARGIPFANTSFEEGAILIVTPYGAEDYDDKTDSDWFTN